MTISSLEEKIAKEESYKLEAIECCRKEKQARNEAERMNVSLTTELEKVSNVKSAVEQKAIANEEMYKTSQEFNNRLLPHNSCLQSNLETTNQAYNRLETEKSSIVEQLSTVRGHNKALQEQLASLKMDAEVISAGILREVLEVGELSLHEIRSQIGSATAHLVHESLHVKNFASRVDVLDDHNAAALRKFCLTYYDIRALILDLALKLDMMRHLGHLPRYQQQIISLQVMKIYAPLAHAVGTNYISLELEDLSFQYLFPYSYLYVDTWLRSQESGGISLIDVYKDNLLQSLKADPLLAEFVDDISVKGRYKSRYSTMKKLLKDGRRPEDVNDVLGLRVVLNPKPGDNAMEAGEKACYRAHEIIQSMWKEIPSRTKDYIARPKGNGYKSLHMAVDVSDIGRTRPLMEIQIRTTEMDRLAVGGMASHSLYKAGLTDPEEAKRLKTIMLAAAELAALRLKDFPSANHKGIEFDERDRVFRLLDKNGDGKISIEELTEVIEELGAPGEDAHDMMLLLDSNSDGSLSSDEFQMFQKQVEMVRNLEDRDDEYKKILDEKLHMEDNSGLIQVYNKEFGNRLVS